MSVRPAILARLRGVQRAGDGWLAYCPAHQDQHKRSLSVSRAPDGRTLVHCFVGCSAEQVVVAVSMRMADLMGPAESRPSRTPLTLAAFAETKALPVDFLRAMGVREDERGLVIEYRLADGSLAPRQRRRTALAAKDGSTWDGSRGESPVAYGLWRLDEARGKGELLLVEGESDTLTAWYHHVPCLGIPGADMAKVLSGDALTLIEKVWIVKEPDRGGETFIAGLAARLAALTWRGEAKVITLGDAKDLNDLHRTAGDRFAEALDRAKAAAVPLGSHQETREGDASPPGLDAMTPTFAQHGTEYEYPAADDDRRLRSGPARSLEPELTETPDGYLVTWPPTEVAVRFETLRDDHRDGHTADVALFAGEQLLTFGRLGLASAQSRATLVKPLDTRPAPAGTWRELLEHACYLVSERVKAGTPPVTLTGTPPGREAELVRDFLPAGDPVVLYGPGAAGKSLTALLATVALETGRAVAGFEPQRRARVAICDWETTKEAWDGRLWGVCRGLGLTPPALIYFRMERPLGDELRRLTRDFRACRIETAIFDSAAYACAGAPEESGEAIRFFQAVRQLRVPALVLAHMSKAGIDAAEAKPFGSIFWENAPRATLEVRPDGRRDAGKVVERQIGIYNRKSNGRYFPARALAFTIDTDTGVIIPAALAMAQADPGLVTRGLSQRQRVVKALDEHGPMTAEALNSATGIPTRTLYEVCARLVSDSLAVRVPNAKPAQWARTSTRESTS